MQNDKLKVTNQNVRVMYSSTHMKINIVACENSIRKKRRARVQSWKKIDNQSSIIINDTNTSLNKKKA